MESLLLLAEESGTGALIWAFVNSPVGVSIVGGVLLFLLGRLWKAKPAWEKLYNEHKGTFFDAVKEAERALPEDMKGAGHKADKALQFILKLEHPLSDKPEVDLRLALDKAHGDVVAKAAAVVREKKLYG